MLSAIAIQPAQIAPAIALRGYVGPSRPAAEAQALGTTRSFVKDEEIFGEDDRANCFYKVLSGAVRTSKLLSDGRRQIDAFHLPGDIFGIETGEAHRFSAEALGDTIVTVYRRCSLDALSASDSAFYRQIVVAMMRSLERAQNHMLLLGRKSALEKVATFLLDIAERATDHGHIELPMSRVDIADHLGLTVETVSRSLTGLERRNIIALPAHRRSIVLRDRAALRRLEA
jgi:CRP/FNR family nitrogen fixation transcriptional regulator